MNPEGNSPPPCVSAGCEDVVCADWRRELLRVWSCAVTWRVWHSTAWAVYLNLTQDGQLWVESCRSDVVGGKLGPSGTAGTLFTSETGCIIAVVHMRSASAGNRLLWLVWATGTESIRYSCPRGSLMWGFLMIAGCCVCSRWVSSPERSLRAKTSGVF